MLPYLLQFQFTEVPLAIQGSSVMDFAFGSFTVVDVVLEDSFNTVSCLFSICCVHLRYSFYSGI